MAVYRGCSGPVGLNSILLYHGGSCRGKQKKKKTAHAQTSMRIRMGWWGEGRALSSPSTMLRPPSSREVERLAESQSDQRRQQLGRGLEGRNLFEM